MRAVKLGLNAVAYGPFPNARYVGVGTPAMGQIVSAQRLLSMGALLYALHCRDG
jgi:hypothetical protein